MTVDEHAERVAAELPPLTDGQRRRLRTLFAIAVTDDERANAA